jgi:hypothetical protein
MTLESGMDTEVQQYRGKEPPIRESRESLPVSNFAKADLATFNEATTSTTSTTGISRHRFNPTSLHRQPQYCFWKATSFAALIVFEVYRLQIEQQSCSSAMR